MKQISSADFRKTYARESEPIEVTAYGKIIGYWYPNGVDLPEIPPLDQTPEVEHHFSTRPAQGPVRVTAVSTKQVHDPLVLRSLERQRFDEFSSRMYGPKKKAVTTLREKS